MDNDAIVLKDAAAVTSIDLKYRQAVGWLIAFLVKVAT